jgi:hypothetical protein
VLPLASYRANNRNYPIVIATNTGSSCLVFLLSAAPSSKQ